jgi:hypothetical protein
MQDYDSMAPVKIVPYAMLAGPSSLNGIRIKTDRHGFRVTQNQKESFSLENIENYDKINIIIGGSAAFGVGATSDKSTIASILSTNTNEVWLNLGIRSCNSFQEIIHLNRFLYKSKKINKIVIFSGTNDLYLRLVNDFHTDFDFGFGTKYSSISHLHPYKQALSVFFSSLYNTDPEEIGDKSISEIIFWPIVKSKYKDKSINSSVSLDEKIKLYLDLYKRNFEIYNGISKAYNCNIQFILQPLIFWSNKEVSSNEGAVLRYLDELQKGDYWAEVKKTLADQSIKNQIVENLNLLAKNYKLSFFDSNCLFKDVSEDCFVDSVHLCDYGNKIIADYISKL